MRAGTGGEQARHQGAPHQVEVLGLAEEVGLVGGDDVDQMRQFGLHSVTAEQVSAVKIEVLQLQCTQTAAKPAFHHQPLARRQADAHLPADQVGNAVEVGRGKAVFLCGAAGKDCGCGWHQAARA